MKVIIIIIRVITIVKRGICVASFPGLHAQLLLLAVRKAGEGLDGLIT